MITIFLLTLASLIIIPMVELVTAQKAKGQSLATTDPSFQLCPSGTTQHVGLNMTRGRVMKVTIRRL